MRFKSVVMAALTAAANGAGVARPRSLLSPHGHPTVPERPTSPLDASRNSAPSGRAARRSTLLVASAALLLDQASKSAIATLLVLGDSVTVTTFFSLEYVLNPGAAFSLLADAEGWQRPALALLGIAVSIWLASEIWRGRAQRVERTAYALIIGGALGNTLDRVRLGAVTDFLDFHWAGFHWPAFNLADVAINVGVVLLVGRAFGSSQGAASSSRSVSTRADIPSTEKKP